MCLIEGKEEEISVRKGERKLSASTLGLLLKGKRGEK